MDLQHGCMDYETALAMIRAVDLTDAVPIVRVPRNEPGIIGRVLDAGALGLIVPMIESLDDAVRLVDAARYPPLGRRSLGPTRVGLRDGPHYVEEADARIVVVPMIETRGALDAVEEIVALDGIDGAFVGPFDLSLALGLPPGENDGDPEFDAVLARVVEACDAAGRFAAAFSSPGRAAERVRQGFRMVSVIPDVAALVGAARGALDRVRGDLDRSL
ncbi:MAG: aldolase/citrate lyase family protein [Pseudomonadales bacterium]|nr:aldolase/citrate lyase family protein [Pseudomonadales bacterium]